MQQKRTFGTALALKAALGLLVAVGMLNGGGSRAHAQSLKSNTTIWATPTTLQGGQTATALVCVTKRAPNGGAGITVYSSDSLSATVPALVTVPAGESYTTFTVQTLGVAQKTTVLIWITNNLTGETAQCPITINPAPKPPASYVTMRFSPPSVQGGQMARLVIDNPVPTPGGLVCQFTSSNTFYCPVSVAAFTLTATRLTPGIPTTKTKTNQQVTVTMTFGTRSLQAVLTITPSQ